MTGGVEQGGQPDRRAGQPGWVSGVGGIQRQQQRGRDRASVAVAIRAGGHQVIEAVPPGAVAVQVGGAAALVCQGVRREGLDGLLAWLAKGMRD